MGIKPKVEKKEKETKKTSKNAKLVAGNPVKIDGVKQIEMKDIMYGLGIEVSDIVCVHSLGAKHFLKCNDKYDLVKMDGKYDKEIPNLILGMVSGKCSYDVYSIKYSIVQGAEKCLNS